MWDSGQEAGPAARGIPLREFIHMQVAFLSVASTKDVRIRRISRCCKTATLFRTERLFRKDGKVLPWARITPLKWVTRRCGGEHRLNGVHQLSPPASETLQNPPTRPDLFSMPGRCSRLPEYDLPFLVEYFDRVLEGTQECVDWLFGTIRPGKIQAK